MISPIPAFPAPDSPDPLAVNNPFSTPPSIEAALARDPAAPQSDPSSAGSPDPAAVARFRQALALHEDLAASPASASAPAPATLASLAAAASAALSQSAAFSASSASLAACSFSPSVSS